MNLYVKLKIKLKYLAIEARCIRVEERRLKKEFDKPDAVRLFFDLRHHRTWDVRHEARHTQLAYAYLRGRLYRDVEAKCRELPDWNHVWKMVKRYIPTAKQGKEYESFILWSQESQRAGEPAHEGSADVRAAS